MKEVLITTLRDKKTNRAEYRSTTEKLAALLAIEVAAALPQEKVLVETPFASVQGMKFSCDVILVPVLRSGLALLYPFLHYFSHARVGFIGMKRDEATAVAHHYYSNLPPLAPEARLIVLEPMIATGGSGIATVKILREAGVPQENILFVSIIASMQGIENLRVHHPKIHLIVAQTDQGLNASKFIVPGLGDFGDRYFGT